MHHRLVCKVLHYWLVQLLFCDVLLVNVGGHTGLLCSLSSRWIIIRVLVFLSLVSRSEWFLAVFCQDTQSSCLVCASYLQTLPRASCMEPFYMHREEEEREEQRKQLNLILTDQLNYA